MKKSWMIFVITLFVNSHIFGQTGTTPLPAETTPSQVETASNPSDPSSMLAKPEPLNPEVRLEVSDKVSKVFRDMVVVQRKAKNKSKQILFNPILGIDFADGPATLYTMNLNVGYAVNDFWELYLNYVPAFIVQERGIVKMLASQEVYQKNSSQPFTFKIDYARPSTQIGAEVLWAPAYGKDSWGPYTMFRSDTFFKIGAYQMTFPEVNKKGMRFAFMGGKTYFAAKYFNVRVAAGLHHMQTFQGITEEEKQRFNTILFLEGGLVFYL